jgi:hypothetical protein
MRQITSKISAIQNGLFPFSPRLNSTCGSASLGEHRIRELNDEINKQMRQKHYWEIRIRELGGGDYNNVRRQLSDVGEESHH